MFPITSYSVSCESLPKDFIVGVHPPEYHQVLHHACNYEDVCAGTSGPLERDTSEGIRGSSLSLSLFLSLSLSIACRIAPLVAIRGLRHTDPEQRCLRKHYTHGFKPKHCMASLWHSSLPSMGPDDQQTLCTSTVSSP